MSREDADRIWTQEELRAHLLRMGMTEEQIGQEPIPQNVKFIAWPQPPVTQKNIDRAEEVEAQLKAAGKWPLE